MSVSTGPPPPPPPPHTQTGTCTSPPTKEGVVSCLFHRARTLKERMYRSRRRTPQESWRETGTPDASLRTASKLHTVTAPSEIPRATAFIPYMAGLSEDVRQACRRYSIRTIFRSAPTLHGQLMQDRDPLEKKSNVIYQ